MFSLFINIALIAKTLWHGFRRDDEFRTIVILLLVLLAGGTGFYSVNEGWRVLDSLYFCVMTLSTIGYGDLAPTSDGSKAFTIVFTIAGLGLFASFIGKLVALRLDAHQEAKRRHKMKSGTKTPSTGPLKGRRGRFRAVGKTTGLEGESQPKQ